jgi:hypothetical protein
MEIRPSPALATHGDGDGIDNLVLLHPNRDRQVHSEGLVVGQSASREVVREGLSRMRGNSYARFLGGSDGNAALLPD